MIVQDNNSSPLSITSSSLSLAQSIRDIASEKSKIATFFYHSLV